MDKYQFFDDLMWGIHHRALNETPQHEWISWEDAGEQTYGAKKYQTFAKFRDDARLIRDRKP